MMSLWNISRTIAEFIESNKQTEILDVLMSHPLEQRRFIVAIQHQDSSLLFHAVKNELLLVVIFFLQNCGADPNSFGLIQGEKITCLAAATLADSSILVKTLLYYRADTEIVFTPNIMTALYFACMVNRLQIAKILIKNRANLNYQCSMGKTCLMVSTHNLELFKLLVSAGADINLADRFGVTCLMLALDFGMSELITFLLDLEDTQVRLSWDAGTDALYHAVEFSPQHVVDKVIEKGSYTIEEVARVYEMRSCEYHVINSQRAREFWETALILRRKPISTRMFAIPYRAGKLNEVIHLFNADDVPPLLFLDSMSGFSLYTAYVYTLAACKVTKVEVYISLCKFFFKEIESMEDTQFFRMLFHGCMLMKLLFTFYNIQVSHGLEVLNLLAKYVKHVKTRLISQQQSVHDFKINFLMSSILDSMHQIYCKFPENIDSFFNPIRHLIKLDLRGSWRKSLLQKCALEHEYLIEPIFLAHGADVNSFDRLGKTVLHDLVETANVSPNLISLIADLGFDFCDVASVEYCLPCRLRKRGLLRTPVKHTSLQCLAIKAFCENTMTSFNEVPFRLIPIVKSHLHC